MYLLSADDTNIHSSLEDIKLLYSHVNRDLDNLLIRLFQIKHL